MGDMWLLLIIFFSVFSVFLNKQMGSLFTHHKATFLVSVTEQSIQDFGGAITIKSKN
jgi:hypothetical protein